MVLVLIAATAARGAEGGGWVPQDGGAESPAAETAPESFEQGAALGSGSEPAGSGASGEGTATAPDSTGGAKAEAAPAPAAAPEPAPAPEPEPVTAAPESAATASEPVPPPTTEAPGRVEPVSPPPPEPAEKPEPVGVGAAAAASSPPEEPAGEELGVAAAVIPEPPARDISSVPWALPFLIVAGLVLLYVAGALALNRWRRGREQRREESSNSAWARAVLDGEAPAPAHGPRPSRPRFGARRPRRIDFETDFILAKSRQAAAEGSAPAKAGEERRDPAEV